MGKMVSGKNGVSSFFWTSTYPFVILRGKNGVSSFFWTSTYPFVILRAMGRLPRWEKWCQFIFLDFDLSVCYPPGLGKNGVSSFFWTSTYPFVILRAMGRLPRAIDDGLVYHALNRGNNRADVFGDDGRKNGVSSFFWTSEKWCQFIFLDFDLSVCYPPCHGTTTSRHR